MRPHLRHHLRLQTLLPALAGAAIAQVAACGGSVSGIDGTSSSGGGSSSGTASGSSTSSSSSSSGSTSGSTSSTSSSGGTSTSSSGGSSGTVNVFNLDVCNGAEHRLLEGVTAGNGVPGPDGAIEYMELRDEYPPDFGSTTPIVLAKEGTACASAVNPTKCNQDLTALRSATGWQPVSYGLEPGPRHRYLVYTIGDVIKTATTLDALVDLIKPMENVKDAALITVATSLYRFPCDGTKNAMKTAAGWELIAQSGHTCGSGTHLDEHVIEVTTNGTLTVKSTKLLKAGDPNCAIGRRPEGLFLADSDCDPEQRENAEGAAIGRFFAEAAHLEAASIVAFERLAEELTALGAPEELVLGALSSREDEVRHARMTAKAARRFGGHPKTPEVAPARLRTALEIALENAVEGCVRETFGALVAHHQAATAADRSIKSIMESIAEDETRHAGLAWDVAAWLEPQLDEEGRALVSSARTNAIRELRSVLAATEPERDLAYLAGMPNAVSAVAMLDGLSSSFLEQAAA